METTLEGCDHANPTKCTGASTKVKQRLHGVTCNDCGYRIGIDITFVKDATLWHCKNCDGRQDNNELMCGFATCGCKPMGDTKRRRRKRTNFD
jgi:hypothetical protein